MPGSMPFHLEKGPYFSVLEDFCNGSRERLEVALGALRDPNQAIPEIGGVLGSQKMSGGPVTTERLKRHVYEDWFGFTKDATGTWSKAQSGFHPIDNPTTGYWVQYYGEVEQILRETLVRAAEVALGIDHDKPVPAGGAPRHWPIELFWKCGQPWWEGWVTWRHDRATGVGQVTVILATPSSGHEVLDDPTRGRNGVEDEYAENPASTREPGRATERRQGTWVVTHRGHDERVVVTTGRSREGEWRFPTLGTAYVGKGGVVVVQPAFPDGGTAGDGLPFIPA